MIKNLHLAISRFSAGPRCRSLVFPNDFGRLRYAKSKLIFLRNFQIFPEVELGARVPFSMILRRSEMPKKKINDRNSTFFDFEFFLLVSVVFCWCFLRVFVGFGLRNQNYFFWSIFRFFLELSSELGYHFR